MSSSLLGNKKMEAALGESRSIRLFGVDIPISSPPAKKPLSSPLMMGIKKHIRLFGVNIAVCVMIPVKEKGLPAIKNGSFVPRVLPASCCPHDPKSSVHRLPMIPGMKQEPSFQESCHSMAIVVSDVQDPLIQQDPRSGAGPSDKRKAACHLDSTVLTKKLKSARADLFPIDAVPLNAVPITPREELFMKIRNMGGVETNPMIRKSLTASDCHGNQARLTIPCKQITYQPLTDSEQKWLNSRDQYGKLNKIMIDVFDPEMRTWNMALKKWDYGSSSCYVLCSTWNALKDVNQLKKGHPVEVWSFRVGGTLSLAISC